MNTDLDHNAYFGVTKDEPFFPEHNETLEFLQKKTNLSQSYNSNYENLIHEGHNWDSVIDLKMDVLYRKRTQSLCRGIVSNKYFHFNTIGFTSYARNLQKKQYSIFGEMINIFF